MLEKSQGRLLAGCFLLHPFCSLCTGSKEIPPVPGPHWHPVPASADVLARPVLNSSLCSQAGDSFPGPEVSWYAYSSLIHLCCCQGSLWLLQWGRLKALPSSPPAWTPPKMDLLLPRNLGITFLSSVYTEQKKLYCFSPVLPTQTCEVQVKGLLSHKAAWSQPAGCGRGWGQGRGQVRCVEERGGSPSIIPWSGSGAVTLWFLFYTTCICTWGLKKKKRNKTKTENAGGSL